MSIPDDMLMALDDAEARLTAAPTTAPQLDQHSMHVPQFNQTQMTPVNQQPAPLPVNPEPVPRPSINPPSDELDRLRHEVTLLRQERAKDDVQRVTAQLQNTRADVTLLRTQLNNTARTDQELRREMERLKEQLAWKDQELREVRMSALDQPAAPTDQPLAASDSDHVVYNVNTESDESESHSVNDQSTHVLNLRMKVGTGNTQAAATSSAGKHSPTNLQQLQLQGTKSRVPPATKTVKPAASPSAAPSKKVAVPSKGHKRPRDEMSREEPDEPMPDPVNKENTQLKRVSRSHSDGLSHD
jgi:regulator of replication initiation timing